MKLFSSVFLLITFASPLFAQDRERPNIIWMIVDDMSAEFSCYGETLIETPHLDRLAQNGVLFSNALLWWYWILPALIGQPMLRLYLLAEHSGCDYGPNMLENSRTTYTVPWLNFLAWNMPYHAEHHYLASVPFHALPALHAYTGQRVKHLGDGYYRVNRDIAARQ